jgi:hypothetical protein
VIARIASGPRFDQLGWFGVEDPIVPIRGDRFGRASAESGWIAERQAMDNGNQPSADEDGDGEQRLAHQAARMPFLKAAAFPCGAWGE